MSITGSARGTGSLKRKLTCSLWETRYTLWWILPDSRDIPSGSEQAIVYCAQAPQQTLHDSRDISNEIQQVVATVVPQQTLHDSLDIHDGSQQVVATILPQQTLYDSLNILDGS